MHIQVELFAVLRETAGQAQLQVELPHKATVGELRVRLQEFFPNQPKVLESSRIAVNNQFAPDSLSLNPDDEIAVIPPVSGG